MKSLITTALFSIALCFVSFQLSAQTIYKEDFKTGIKNWQIVTWDNTDAEPVGVKKLSVNESQWLKTPRKGCFFFKQQAALPETFTLEYDLWADTDKTSEMEGGLSCVIIDYKASKASYDYHFSSASQIKIDVHPSQDIVYLSAHKEYGNDNAEIFKEIFEGKWKKEEVNKVKIVRNKTQVSLYLNGEKLMDVSNALNTGKTYSLLFATNLWGDGMYISNINLKQ